MTPTAETSPGQRRPIRDPPLKSKEDLGRRETPLAHTDRGLRDSRARSVAIFGSHTRPHSDTFSSPGALRVARRVTPIEDRRRPEAQPRRGDPSDPPPTRIRPRFGPPKCRRRRLRQTFPTRGRKCQDSRPRAVHPPAGHRGKLRDQTPRDQSEKVTFRGRLPRFGDIWPQRPLTPNVFCRGRSVGRCCAAW